MQCGQRAGQRARPPPQLQPENQGLPKGPGNPGFNSSSSGLQQARV